MIFVGLIAVTRFHELVPRDARHRIQQALVVDAPGAELSLHHVPALDGETIGMKFGSQRRLRILPRACYCLYGRGRLARALSKCSKRICRQKAQHFGTRN